MRVVEEDDPLLAFRRAQGGAPADTTADPLARFRAKYSGTHPLDVPPVRAESTSSTRPVPVRRPSSISARVLDAETSSERNVGRLASVYQGFTFGAGDKIAAGIKTLLPEAAGGSKGWNFRENLRETREPLNDYRMRHPIEAGATEIVGAVPSAIVAAPLSLSARVAGGSRMARLAGLMGDGAIFGSTVGGLDAIQPDATIGDVGRGAMYGAGAGAVAGPVIGSTVAPLVRGTGRLAARLFPRESADRIAAMFGGEAVTPRGQAKSSIRGALQSGGVDIAETAQTAGLIPPASAGGEGGRRFPATERVVTDFMAEKGVPREEAVRRLTAAGYDVPAQTYQFPEWPLAGDRSPEGLDVSRKIDNRASIDATFDLENDYRLVPGIRQIALEGEVGPNSFKPDARTRRLAEEIKANNRIDPLIWVDDPNGGYLLEGAHRIDALRLLGHKSFPALVVQDLKAAAKAAAASSGRPMAGRLANDEIRRIAEEYRAASNVDAEPMPHPSKVDPEKAGVMAHAYEALKNDPTDPEVIAAYRALATETRAQYDALIKAGYKPEFMVDDPYTDSAAMMKDLAERKTNKENPHPLLSDEENDMFRFVHDVFGHGQSGNQFGPLGEERAFRDHAAMFSPLARRAMATETRGQNSWVNFGPNAALPVTSRPYAEQKAALWPRETMGDYSSIPRESPTTVMELGSRQVPSLVRAARNVPASTAAQTTDRFLAERSAGAGKRIERALNDATGHEPTDSWMSVDQLIEKRANAARPLYEQAENYGAIQNPETVAQIELLRKHPVFARAWSRGQAMGELEGTPATQRVVTQAAQSEVPRIAPDAPPPAPSPVAFGAPANTREAIAAFQDRSAAASSRTEGTSIQQQARRALERRSAEAELPDAPRRLTGGTLQEPRAAVPEEAMQAPTVQQINRWKKGLDAIIQSGYGSENALSREEARLLRQKLNDVLARVDEEVPVFREARQSYRGNSELVEAAEAGSNHFAPGTPTGAIERQLAAMTPGELEAYRGNALNKLVEQIRRSAANPDLPEAGRTTSIIQRMMGSEDAGQRLGMLFPDEKAYHAFLRQVEDEALYPKTDRFLRGQSSTAAQLAEGKTSLSTWRDLAMSPFSHNARWRLVRRMGDDMLDQKMPTAVANEVGEMATQTGFQLRALLQEMLADETARNAGRQRLLTATSAASAAAMGDKSRLIPPGK